MDKIEVKMKLENICLTEQAWKSLDLLSTSVGGNVSRDILIGSLINAGLEVIVGDLKDISTGVMSFEDVLRRTAEKKGISVEYSEKLDKAIQENGVENCFKKTV